jgi:Asp-tRNA(Asn)/Glu-tRNA(Gln) amidotransferase C subunit
MSEPGGNITVEALRHYARMFDIPLTDDEIAALCPQIAGGLAAIAELWRVDVGGVEPSTILPIDRR